MGCMKLKLRAVLPTLFLLLLQAIPVHAADGEPPEPPGAITVTRGDSQLRATWNPVPGADEYKYNITYRQGPLCWPGVSTCGGGPRGWISAFSGVTVDTEFQHAADNPLTYRVTVNARNEHGYSSNTTAQSPPIQAPPAPGAVRIGWGVGTQWVGSLNASWNLVPGADEYEVSIYHLDDQQNWIQDWASPHVWRSQQFFSSISKTRTYRVEVRSRNASGFSEWTSSSTLLPFLPPDPPVQVIVTRGDRTLTATWDAVPGATGYNVGFFDDRKNRKWNLGGETSDNVFTSTAVHNDRYYIVGIMAKNEAGWSARRYSAVAIPWVPAPGPITLTRGDGIITATWDPVPGAKDYHVNYSTDDQQTWLHGAGNLPDTKFAMAADNALTYTVSVRARHSRAYSAWQESAPAGPFHMPGAQPTATPVPQTQALLSAPSAIWIDRFDQNLNIDWDPVPGALEYHVKWSTDGGQSWLEENVDANPQTATVLSMGADRALTYIAAVRVWYAGGHSDWSDYATSGPFQPHVSGTQPTATPVPQTQAPLSAPSAIWIDRFDQALRINWVPVPDALEYHVKWSMDGGQSWLEDDVDANPQTATALHMNADKTLTYIASVRVRSAGGYSDWSDYAISGPFQPHAVQSIPTAVPTFTPTSAQPIVSTAMSQNTPLPAVPVTNSTSNLRKGPGTAYQIVGQLDAGTSLIPVAHNGDGTWLQLDVGVWIWASLVNNIPVGLPLAANIPQIPDLTATPEPAATPLPAFTPTPAPTAVPTATPLKIPLFDTPPQPTPAPITPITPVNHGKGDRCNSSSEPLTSDSLTTQGTWIDALAAQVLMGQTCETDFEYLVAAPYMELRGWTTSPARPSLNVLGRGETVNVNLPVSNLYQGRKITCRQEAEPVETRLPITTVAVKIEYTTTEPTTAWQWMRSKVTGSVQKGKTHFCVAVAAAQGGDLTKGADLSFDFTDLDDPGRYDVTIRVCTNEPIGTQYACYSSSSKDADNGFIQMHGLVESLVAR